MKKIFTWQNIVAAVSFVLALVCIIFSYLGIGFTIAACVLMVCGCGMLAYIFYMAYARKDEKYRKLKAEFIVIYEDRYGENASLENTDYSEKNEKKFYNKISYLKYCAIFFGVVCIYLLYELISLIPI